MLRHRVTISGAIQMLQETDLLFKLSFSHLPGTSSLSQSVKPLFPEKVLHFNYSNG